MPSAQAVPVTLAEIARIAGVGRAAVSNWRRRHDTFPDRIGGTDASPQFSLAEVEEWLRSNSKLKNAGGRELLWPRFEALGSRDEAGLAIAEAGRRMRGGRARAMDPPLSPDAQELIGEAARLGRREGAKETFDFLLQRWLDAHVRQISTTPPALAALMAEIALRVGTNRSANRVTVLDPACGTGHLLAAAAEAHRSLPVELLGCEQDPALAALAAARLASGQGPGDVTAEIRAGDSLLADPFSGVTADVVLCNPPFNERDWGYEELATDSRWTHGLPPRTEPELAWVQHALAHLEPGGTAVVLMPPAVASRKAGRRIRGALLRSGILRAVIALPPGSAQPHSVSLHLWVLRAGHAANGTGDVTLVDAARAGRSGGREAGAPDWEALADFVRSVFDAIDPELPAVALPPGAARVSLIDLLDDEVDLTPGRYVASTDQEAQPELADSWQEFTALLTGLQQTGKVLAGLDLAGGGERHAATTVGDLARAGALTLRSGQQPSDGAVQKEPPAAGGVPLLTVPDLLLDTGSSGWLASADAVVVAEPGDVIVAGVARAFSAWVHQGQPTALGPQLHALRVAPDMLDAHFLAGCLRAPSNGRQAGTHASSSSRVDVRRLHVLQLPLEDQRQYSEAFRTVKEFHSLISRLDGIGTGLVNNLSDRLVAGRLPAGR
ncbi:N-6 DNA methylase [Streptomyces sp. NPDC051020]|uniref:N-6 DNA methylase n=1 Tax=Streptomyces sp. NPDC051020 TaxID=3155409 RepID=UPI003438055E